MKKQKVCSKCHKLKDVSEFSKDKHLSYGLRSSCKDCCKIYKHAFYDKHKDRLNEENRQWRLNNPDKVKENYDNWYLKNRDYKLDYNKEYYENNIERERERSKIYNREHKDEKSIKHKEWSANNRDKINENSRKRKKDDVIYYLSCRIRNNIRVALRRMDFKKGLLTKEILGCSIEFFKDYIIAKFTDEMTWDIFCTGDIHLDHIIPLVSAKDIDSFYKLCHYTNYQPMWGFDNISKGGEIPQNVQFKLL